MSDEKTTAEDRAAEDLAKKKAAEDRAIEDLAKKDLEKRKARFAKLQPDKLRFEKTEADRKAGKEISKEDEAFVVNYLSDVVNVYRVVYTTIGGDAGQSENVCARTPSLAADLAKLVDPSFKDIVSATEICHDVVVVDPSDDRLA